MASEKVQLKLSFLTSEGKKLTTVYNNADSEVTSSNVNALMDALITNGEIFDTPPATKESANLIITETNPITVTPPNEAGLDNIPKS